MAILIYLHVYYWQNNAVQDLMSGFCNIGDLMPQKSYTPLEKNREDVELDRKHYTP